MFTWQTLLAQNPRLFDLAGIFLIVLLNKMTVYHDEVEIEDFEYDEDAETYYYPCPCGDRFEITKVR